MELTSIDPLLSVRHSKIDHNGEVNEMIIGGVGHDTN